MGVVPGHQDTGQGEVFEFAQVFGRTELLVIAGPANGAVYLVLGKPEAGLVSRGLEREAREAAGNCALHGLAHRVPGSLGLAEGLVDVGQQCITSAKAGRNMALL